MSQPENISFLHQEQFYHKKGISASPLPHQNGKDIQEILVSNSYSIAQKNPGNSSKLIKSEQNGSK